MASENVYTLRELRKRVIKSRSELQRAISLLNSAASARDFMFESGNYAAHEVDTEIQSRLDVIKEIVDNVAFDFKTGTNNSTPTTRINYDHAVFYKPGLIDIVRELTIVANVGGLGTSATITPKLRTGISVAQASRATSGFLDNDIIRLENSTDSEMDGTYGITTRNVSTGIITLSDEIPRTVEPGSAAVDDATMTLTKVSR